MGKFFSILRNFLEIGLFFHHFGNGGYFHTQKRKHLFLTNFVDIEELLNIIFYIKDVVLIYVFS